MPALDLRSLKVRVLLLAAVSIGVTMLVAGITLVVLFERHIQRRIGDELGVRWDELAASVSADENGRVVFTRQLTDPRYEEPLSGAYWQITGGDQVLRSRSLWDVDLATRDGADPRPYEMDGPQNSELYVVSRGLSLGEGTNRRPYVLSVVLDHRDIHALSEAYEADLIKALSIIALALFGGAWLQADVGLEPLRQLRRAVERIRTGATVRLGQGYASEVQPLVDDLDHMLDRNDQLLRKSRDRAGALAHGLKTPLTILSIERRKLAERGETAAAEVLREQIETIRRHAERELVRSRIHGAAIGGSALGAAAPADLGLIARRLVDLVGRMPKGEELDFRVFVPEGLSVTVDQADLGEVLGNLLDNARKWAASRVEIRAENIAEGVLVSVIDDGPGPGAAPDSGNDEGSGLGLLIVSDVLGEYGSAGELLRDGELTVYRFVIPRTDAASHTAGRREPDPAIRFVTASPGTRDNGRA